MKQAQSSHAKKINKIREEAHRVLEPNSTASQHQKHQAETQIRELEAYRKQGEFIRAKHNDISDGSQLTRHHILKAKIKHEHSLTYPLLGNYRMKMVFYTNHKSRCKTLPRAFGLG